MKISKIVICGAGTMGFSEAQIFAQYALKQAEGGEEPLQVTLWNHREAKLVSAREQIEKNAAALAEAGELTQEQGQALAGSINFTTDLSVVGQADLVIENIVENLDAKLTFCREMSPLAGEETILATNTSGLSINTLAGAVQRPERFLGMHWFNPPTLIPLIEIIRNDQTTDEAAQAIYDLSLAIGKKPAIVQRDVPGFAANRLQLAVVREALDLVQKGVISREGIDAVMKYGLGFRWAVLGPLETLDFGGLDTFDHISEYLIPDLCDSHDIPVLLHEAYERGDLGVKTGKGFYDYSDGRGAQKMAERDEKLTAVYNALYKEK